jgi:ADP-heptose:LPS heptosyltransferase
MKTLIVNLTRMGDLLQTTPLLKGLKDEDPDGRLDVMVVEDFRAVTDGFDMVDEVLALDLNSLIPKFDQPDTTIVDLHTELADWIESVRKRGYDRLINLSHTRISAALVRLLDVPDTRGVTLSEEGYILIRHPWLNYFFNVTMSRTFNPINLVDMYLGAGDIKHPPKNLRYKVTDEARSFASAFLTQHESLALRPFYGIQPGAMQENRRWPVESWARLCDLVWEELGGTAIIFGAKPDTDIGHQIEGQVGNPIINAIGKTTISQLAGLLTRCEMLVTNDTGTMHLAAAVGTPIVAIFLAAARSDDTAPYGRGHLILEANIDCAPCSYHTGCANPVCHSTITPKVVLDAIQSHPARHEGITPNFHDQGEWTSVRASMTDFDSWGWSILRQCIARSWSRKQILSTAYRFLWRAELQGNEDDYELSSYRSMLEDMTCDVVLPEDAVSFQEGCDSLDRLQRLAALGLQRAQIMAKMATEDHPDLKLLQNITAHFVVIDKDIYGWELSHPDLAPLVIHFRIEKGNIERDDLTSLSQKAESLYGGLATRAKRFQMILRETEKFLMEKQQSGIGKVTEIL